MDLQETHLGSVQDSPASLPAVPITSNPNLSISVIISLHNGARFAVRALESVFAQTVPVAEIIVVDDGSTDDGPAIVSQYATFRPVTLLRNQNHGASAARSFGIRHSAGVLIAFLDQDAIWYPDHLSALSAPFMGHESGRLGWTYGNFDEVSDDNKLRVRSALAGGNPKVTLDRCLAEDMSVRTSASLVSRTAFDAIGGFDEQLYGYEDDDLFLRLFTAGYRNIYIPRPLARCRIAEASRSSAMIQGRMRYAGKLAAAFPDEPQHARFYTSDFIMPRFLRQAVAQVKVALRSGRQQDLDVCVAEVAVLKRQVSPDRRLPLDSDTVLITTVIPLYNGAPFIREAIQSVLDQTRAPDEIIVVDDGSTDAGPDIVADMARTHPIRLIRTQNSGQSAARNLGVDHAHGDLIAFLDQDDVWYPNHLAELVVPFFEKRHRELGWSYSDLDEINESGGMVGCRIISGANLIHPKPNLVTCLKHDMFILPSASLVSRQAFLKVGGFDERLSGYEDDDLFLRLFQAGFDHVFLAQSLSKWRIYQTSSSYSPRMAVSRAIYARMLIERFPDNPDVPRFYIKELIAPRFFRTMSIELRKAILKGTKADRRAAHANLAFISGYLPGRLGVPLRLFVLPALRVPGLARLLMRHRGPLIKMVRRFFL
jgi:glycosyltransferase involved in cell wall biosynthesis